MQCLISKVQAQRRASKQQDMIFDGQTNIHIKSLFGNNFYNDLSWSIKSTEAIRYIFPTSIFLTK